MAGPLQLQSDYDRSYSFGWQPSFYTGKTVRRPYMIAGKRRNPNRQRWKRGGRFKKRRACVTGRIPEKKFSDGTVGMSPTVTGTVVNLSAIAQGDSGSERIGRKATITNWNMKGHIGLASEAGTSGSNRVRIVVVQDHSTNGALFVASDVFAISGTADINAYRELDNLGRFTILYDKVFTLNAGISGDGTTSVTSDHMRQFNINLKCCVPIEYNGTSGLIATQNVNSISMITFEEAATPATVVTAVRRFRWID